MAIPLFLAPLLMTLAEKGLGLLGSAVLAKGKDVIEDKLGVSLESAVQSEDGLLKLKQLEVDHEEFLLDIAIKDREQTLNEFKAEVEDRGSARNLQMEALKQDDKFAKRFIYYMTAAILSVSAVYIGFITFATIPKDNIRVVDSVLGFMLGTGLSMVLNFFYGSSMSSKQKDSSIQKLVGRDDD